MAKVDELVAVTDADREAALSWISDWHDHRGDKRPGGLPADGVALVQAFSRHRLASQATDAKAEQGNARTEVDAKSLRFLLREVRTHEATRVFADTDVPHLMYVAVNQLEASIGYTSVPYRVADETRDKVAEVESWERKSTPAEAEERIVQQVATLIYTEYPGCRTSQLQGATLITDYEKARSYSLPETAVVARLARKIVEVLHGRS